MGMRFMNSKTIVTTSVVISTLILAAPTLAQPLPGTDPLTIQGDLADQMVTGIDRYLTRALAASRDRRNEYWMPDHRSDGRTDTNNYTKSIKRNRERLAHILGVVDKRLPVRELEYVATTNAGALVAETSTYQVYAVRWPVFEGVDAEGLVLRPKAKAVAHIVALPDADHSPEVIAGLAPGLPAEAQYARRLAENGCLVLIPTLIDRKDTWSGNPKITMTNQTHREFIYRMAFEMGRHIIGYEVQKVLAAVDWLTREKDHPPVGVIGYGEGGLLALYSAALDQRIQSTVVSGYFGPREEVWKEPIYRNVWSLLREFGDAELAALVASRTLTIECSRVADITGPPPIRQGRVSAAPGEIHSPSNQAAHAEVEKAYRYYGQFNYKPNVTIYDSADGQPGDNNTLQFLLHGLGIASSVRASGDPPTDKRPKFDPTPRLHRQFDQLVAYTQRLARDGEARRKEFWAKADPSSAEKWNSSCQYYRDYYWEEIIGKLPAPTKPPNPRTRLTLDEPKWRGYQVVLDLHPDVFAFGYLLVPKSLKPGERRPVVVCQHGLEGRPEVVIDPTKRTPYYQSFGAQLADLGYIVYAPQNPYIFDNRFRQLQRKANPLKLTLFSFIAQQHGRTLDWLAGLDFVDPKRMAFYGLSYGGETAVRVPPLLPRYALSICSGDFNQFTWKTTTLDFRGSYILVPTYEIFYFNMGNTYSHAELANMMAPRPFMVERGHDDGVGLDEWVDYEYAKVRRMYSKLGLAERTEIEFFAGGHVINGQGTFRFLKKHLQWPP